MRIPESLQFLPKTLAGIGVVLLGSAIALVPKIGETAGNAVIGAGVMIIIYGATDKWVRFKKGEDVFVHEKGVADKVRATMKRMNSKH